MKHKLTYYRINIKSVCKNLGFSFFIILAFISIVLYAYVNQVEVNVTLMSIFFLSPVLIACFLLIDYYVNANNEVRLFDERIEIINNKKEKVVFNKEEIVGLKIYICPSMNRKSSFQLMPFEQFHFIELIFINNTKFYISSLSDENLYNTIQKNKIFKNKINIVNRGIFDLGYLINSIYFLKIKL